MNFDKLTIKTQEIIQKTQGICLANKNQLIQNGQRYSGINNGCTPKKSLRIREK